MTTNKEIFITREITFCAAHKLFNPAFSEEENEALFSPCHNDHGHNYTLTVMLKGTVSPETGMVMNFRDLDKLMREHVHDKLDHKHINNDIPEFKHMIATAENIAIVIWNWLTPHLADGLLYEIRLSETQKNTVIYRG